MDYVSIEYNGKQLSVPKEVADFLSQDRKRQQAQERQDRRHLSKSDFENLQIDGIENTYIIDIKKQIAILVEAYEYNGTNYYIIDQVKDVIRGGSLVN